MHEELQDAIVGRIARLRPIDDEFMRMMFRGQLGLAQQVLRTITGVEDLVLVGEETQRDLSRLAGARSIVLDVYGEDSRGRRYDLEVQRAPDGAGARRARYHSSAMDVDALPAGAGFEELPETYVIFVTERDPFGRGAALYRFERVEMASGEALALGDGSHVMYASAAAAGEAPGELGALLHDFLCSEPSEMRTPALAERARYLKEDPEGVSQMSEILEELYNEGVEKGIEKGIEQGIEKGIEQGIEKGIEQGIEKGIEKGIEQGIERGIEQNTASSIASLMETMKMTAHQAMDALQVPQSDRPRYLAML